jgi:AraC family transcriptional regulator, dual regulator of chb operon
MDLGASGFHVARHGQSVGGGTVHTHDFAELFWVHSGEVTHRSGGEIHLVRAGDVVLVAPDDAHRFVRPSDDFAMTNLALTEDELHRLRDRYFTDGGFPWDCAPPRLFRLSGDGRRRAESLGSSAVVDPLAVDRFLIDILQLAGAARVETAMPGWLVEAIEVWRRDPVAMSRGVGGLAEIACRSRGHVSRVIHQSTRRPAVELINDVRMEEAAALLGVTDLPIPMIAAEVGVLSLSHFYRLFHTRFGAPPARYRDDSGRRL